MKIWRYSGIFLILTGLLHIAVGILLFKDTFAEYINNGIINSVTENSVQETGFWFLVCGTLVIMWGLTMHHYIRKTYKPAPKFLGYFLLIISLIGGLIVPISGFWLFVPQALIIIMAKERR